MVPERLSPARWRLGDAVDRFCINGQPTLSHQLKEQLSGVVCPFHRSRVQDAGGDSQRCPSFSLGLGIKHGTLVDEELRDRVGTPEGCAVKRRVSTGVHGVHIGVPQCVRERDRLERLFVGPRALTRVEDPDPGRHHQRRGTLFGGHLGVGAMVG